jgi:hypothetical protein
VGAVAWMHVAGRLNRHAARDPPSHGAATRGWVWGGSATRLRWDGCVIDGEPPSPYGFPPPNPPVELSLPQEGRYGRRADVL